MTSDDDNTNIFEQKGSEMLASIFKVSRPRTSYTSIYSRPYQCMISTIRMRKSLGNILILFLASVT